MQIPDTLLHYQAREVKPNEETLIRNEENGMAEFNVVEAHQMSVEDATEKLKSFLGNLQGELDQLKVEEESWEGNVLNFAFTYSGQKITGAMTVGENDVTVKGPLSFILAVFKGQIETSIGENVRKALDA